MDISLAKQTIRGPLIPVITHLHDDLSVDHDAIRENVEYVVARGMVNGQAVLLATGAGGDFPMLTVPERQAVSRTIMDAAGGRVPVLIGAQDTNPDVCIEMARFAEDLGAFGIQVSPAYYYASSEEDCLRLFESIHDATQRIALMIYNTHWEGYHMSLAQIARLAELPRCLSLKWSTPVSDGEYVSVVDRFRDQLAIVDNHGLVIMNHLAGGTGYITHLATVWPEHDARLWSSMEAGDYATAHRYFMDVNWPWREFRGKMWARTAAESPVVKAALELCGRPGGPSRLPTRSLNRQERVELAQLLRSIGVPIVRDA